MRRTDDQVMSGKENIPRVENVDLVPDSRSGGGAPGFQFHFNLVLTIALLLVLSLSYAVFG